ncbi:MAG: hypothetical protein JSV00_10025 [bacterium]|nr:MAG: hypothetical protein JSV00_10025 [bacterium]
MKRTVFLIALVVLFLPLSAQAMEAQRAAEIRYANTSVDAEGELSSLQIQTLKAFGVAAVEAMESRKEARIAAAAAEVAKEIAAQQVTSEMIMEARNQMAETRAAQRVAATGSETSGLDLEKDCAVIGRVSGHKVQLLCGEGASEMDILSPPVVELKGFELYNLSNGKRYDVALSEEGYFFIKLGMGYYAFRRISETGHPFLIDNIVVPHGRIVNVGTYVVQTKSPKPSDEECWEYYSRGSTLTSGRLVHLSGIDSYACCEEWLSECEEKVFQEHSDSIVWR